MARLLGNEIDDLARSCLRQGLTAPKALAKYLHVDVLDHHMALEYITSRSSEIDPDQLIRTCFKRVTLSKTDVEIIIDCKSLATEMLTRFDLDDHIVPRDDEYIFTSTYLVSRTRKGTIMIDAPPQYLAKDDPFNRPDHEIQNWVENTVWRDMHFRGKTLQEIATRDGVGTSYVSRLIDQSLDPSPFPVIS